MEILKWKWRDFDWRVENTFYPHSFLIWWHLSFHGNSFFLNLLFSYQACDSYEIYA